MNNDNNLPSSFYDLAIIKNENEDNKGQHLVVADTDHLEWEIDADGNQHPFVVLVNGARRRVSDITDDENNKGMFLEGTAEDLKAWSSQQPGGVYVLADETADTSDKPTVNTFKIGKDPLPYNELQEWFESKRHAHKTDSNKATALDISTPPTATYNKYIVFMKDKLSGVNGVISDVKLNKEASVRTSPKGVLPGAVIKVRLEEVTSVLERPGIKLVDGNGELQEVRDSDINREVLRVWSWFYTLMLSTIKNNPNDKLCRTTIKAIYEVGNPGKEPHHNEYNSEGVITRHGDLEEIERSLLIGWHNLISIDILQELQAGYYDKYPEVKKAIEKRVSNWKNGKPDLVSILPISRIYDDVTTEGEKVRVVEYFNITPPLLQYATDRRQLTYVPRKALENGLNATKGSQALFDYIFDRVSSLKNQKGKHVEHISVETLYTLDGSINGSRTEQKRTRQKVEKIIDQFEKTGVVITLAEFNKKHSVKSGGYVYDSRWYKTGTRGTITSLILTV